MTRTYRLADLPRWQRPLLGGAWLGIGLLLLTPLVVTPEAAFAFTVGKAVYMRILCAALFALWVPLAMANAMFRPPRSWLLVLLVVSFLVAVLALSLIHI